jgi:hypothetical protein
MKIDPKKSDGSISHGEKNGFNLEVDLWYWQRTLNSEERKRRD